MQPSHIITKLSELIDGNSKILHMGTFAEIRLVF